MSENPQLQVELDESLARTYERASHLRPTNTTKAYSAKQREFIAWCEKKAFNLATRQTVTPAKLHLFLEEEVIGRKRKRGGGSTDKVVGKSTVLAYTAAVVDLWSQQRQLRINSYDNPRDTAVRLLLKNVEIESDAVRKRNYDDRGIGTMLDGYTTVEQMVKIGEHFWAARSDHGPNLRNWLAFLLSHFALLRGESARALELPDLHTVRLDGEGFSECQALILIMRQGKTNQVGRLEVGACLRNRDVRVCPIGALGLYLFWRWHVSQEALPDFTSSALWYDTKVLTVGTDIKTEMSYRVHHAAITTALRAAGLHTKAKTHVARGSGAKMAELSGASEAQIRRLGRWNNQAMELCYLSTLPREVMRTMAGFGKEQGTFFLKRALLDPPEDLQRRVFPWVEDWTEKLADGRCEANIAAGGFLSMLKYLRVVILQDAACLQEAWNHPMWNAEVFSSDQFKAYRSDLLERVNAADDPTELLLQRAMPLLASKVDAMYTEMSSAFSAVSKRMEDIHGAVVPELRVMHESLKRVRVEVSFGDEATSPTKVTGETSTVGSNNEPPEYKLCRGVASVKDLWREWTVGLGGGPAVRELEEKWGTRWCIGSERRFFNRRRNIIRAVRKRALSSHNEESTIAIDAAISHYDTILSVRRKSLDWLSKNVEVL